MVGVERGYPHISLYIITPSDLISHGLSYFSGPRASGAALVIVSLVVGVGTLLAPRSNDNNMCTSFHSMISTYLYYNY